jgi:hypothetical protein
MRIVNLFIPVLAGVVSAMAFTAPPNRTRPSNSTRVPVLLELFTSEGCSSCPPADRLLESLDSKQPVPGAELIVLSEHVDYWNHLGWKDPWSSALYSARQEEYVGKLKSGDVYTPQLVVDGRLQVVGSDRAEVVSAVQKTIREVKIPISISGVTRTGNQLSAHVDIAAAGWNTKAGRATLYVAVADSSDESHVSRGENAGSSLAHVAVVRVLKDVSGVDAGQAVSKDVVLTVPPGGESRVVAFLQDNVSGNVLGAAMRRVMTRGAS